MASIGIDFGSSNIYVAKWEGVAPRIQINMCGGKKSPAYIVAEKNDYIFGEEARALSTVEASRTVFDAWKFMGLTLQEGQRLVGAQKYPFKLTCDDNDKVVFDLSDGDDKGLHLSPAQVIELLLKQVQLQCKQNLGEAAKNCVIAVPHYITKDIQKILTDIAHSVQFDSVKLVDNRIAAVMGCFFNSSDCMIFPDNVGVVDVGASGITVTFFKADNADESSMTTRHDAEHGGDALDLVLMQRCLDEFSKIYKTDLENIDPSAIHRLRIECQNAKVTMATAKSTEICVQNFSEGNDLIYQIDLRTFEAICFPFAEAVVNLVEELLLTEPKLKISDNFQLLPVGGASRIPLVRNALKTHFKGHINASVLSYFEEATVFGAAGLARMFQLAENLDQLSFIEHYRPLTTMSKIPDNLLRLKLRKYFIKHIQKGNREPRKFENDKSEKHKISESSDKEMAQKAKNFKPNTVTDPKRTDSDGYNKVKESLTVINEVCSDATVFPIQRHQELQIPPSVNKQEVLDQPTEIQNIGTQNGSSLPRQNHKLNRTLAANLPSQNPDCGPSTSVSNFRLINHDSNATGYYNNLGTNSKSSSQTSIMKKKFVCGCSLL